MHKLRLLTLCAAVAFSVCHLALFAQSGVPAIRIVDRVDESKLVTLKGNTHPSANAKNDRGRVNSDLPMSDLILVLSRAPEQQAAFENFVATQYDPQSPNFHQWLAPEQVGENFGASQSDISTIYAWLTDHGFSVDEVSKDRMSIRFSGTASLVENAFHTQIHNLSVKGAAHIANMSDPQIPAAIAPVVVGIKQLHDFFPKPLHRMGSQVQRNSKTGKWQRPTGSAVQSKSPRPLFGGTDQTYGQFEDVAPYDFATIYNVLPLWNASTPINGTGQTIAIAGTSDIVLSDVATFRSTFGLPAGLTPIIMAGVNGLDPGICNSTSPTAICGQGDLIENTLDVEWSGSIAPGAQIILVTSGAKSNTDDTIYDSSSYVVSNKTASILNVSYGECELGEGTAGNVSYYNLWQAAASEGIAVFVAAGDSGSASCDEGMDTSVPYPAEYGLSVSGIASTPYNTAVGGTDLYWCPETSQSCVGPAAAYWNSTNSSTGASAKGYVPEGPWNDTCSSPFGVQIAQILASGIGVSGVIDAESACNFAADFNFEQDVYYVFNGYDMSYLVDIVGGSGGASGCIVSDGSSPTSCGIANTTGAANGSIPLVNDGWPKPRWQTGVTGIPADGVRDIPDVSFFASDGFLGSAYLICVSDVAPCSSYTTKVEPSAFEVGGTSVASPAMAGVQALINQKAGSPQGNPNAQLYALAAKQTYSNCSAETVTTSSTCDFNDIDAGSFAPTLVNNIATPCDNGAGGFLSPNCAVMYPGDGIGILSGYNAGTGYDLATGLGSLNVANIVNAWKAEQVTATVTATAAPASINSNQTVTVSGTVSGTGATPTGTVTVFSSSYSSPATTLNATGGYSVTIPINTFTASGNVTLTVLYSGDSTFKPATGSTSVAVVYIPIVATSYTLSATTPAAIAPGSSATSTVTVASANGYSGTVTLASCSLTNSNASNTTADTPQCSAPNPSTPLSVGGKATYTITTKAATTAKLNDRNLPGTKGRELEGAGGGALLALLVFLGIPARRCSWRSMLGALVLMTALGSLAGCGGSTGTTNNNTGDPGTAAGSYTFTVTGTNNVSGTPAAATTFTVTVN
jgi:subtilase family serine protease